MSKVISVVNQKGGCGKTTLLSNLAMNIHSNATVAIVDLDYQGSIKSLESQFDGIPVYPANTTIDEIKELQYDFILVDTPPYVFDRLENLAMISDVIIIPIKPSPLDIIALSRTMEIIESAASNDKMLVILNMIKPNTTLTDNIAREVRKLDINLAKTRISDLVDFTRSIMNGRLMEQKSQLQINALTKEILIKMI